MQITETLNEEFAIFLLTVPAKRLKQNTIKILLGFLKNEGINGSPDFMINLCTDMLFFFDLLDTIDKELDQSGLV
jgi:hypothetical protein